MSNHKTATGLRKPDAQTHQLGHWEAMQISQALDHFAQELARVNAGPGEIEHTKMLARLFQAEATYSVTVTRMEE